MLYLLVGWDWLLGLNIIITRGGYVIRKQPLLPGVCVMLTLALPLEVKVSFPQQPSLASEERRLHCQGARLPPVNSLGLTQLRVPSSRKPLTSTHRAPLWHLCCTPGPAQHLPPEKQPGASSCRHHREEQALIRDHPGLDASCANFQHVTWTSYQPVCASVKPSVKWG